ncbi:MAG: glutamate formimidoyltransferase [Bryobacteraceae bacterium]|nr:glutamate formimidoyltransferase [Bryobacteraceae bacterium]
MTAPLIECIPNFSEGRDAAVIGRIVAAIASVSGALLLDTHSDADHNRTVVTFAGPPEAVVEAAVRGAGAAAESIDMRRHRGAHPRMGALDVLPFVPLEGITLTGCAGLAAEAGEEIWRLYGIPVYLYEVAARRPERRNLANVRRLQFEGLCERAPSDPACRPDIGGPALHPTAGATAAGARKILIAYNIHLATRDATIAHRIAQRVRESSGGLPYVKAMGVYLAARGQAQVSMNLTDFETTPPHVVFEAVVDEAAREGVEVAGSEIVGLIPGRALEMAAGRDLKLEGFHQGLILERRIAEVRGR